MDYLVMQLIRCKVCVDILSNNKSQPIDFYIPIFATIFYTLAMACAFICHGLAQFCFIAPYKYVTALVVLGTIAVIAFQNCKKIHDEDYIETARNELQSYSIQEIKKIRKKVLLYILLPIEIVPLILMFTLWYLDNY